MITEEQVSGFLDGNVVQISAMLMKRLFYCDMLDASLS
jgi:hypothetical protein